MVSQKRLDKTVYEWGGGAINDSLTKQTVSGALANPCLPSAGETTGRQKPLVAKEKKIMELQSKEFEGVDSPFRREIKKAAKTAIRNLFAKMNWITTLLKENRLGSGYHDRMILHLFNDAGFGANCKYFSRTERYINNNHSAYKNHRSISIDDVISGVNWDNVKSYDYEVCSGKAESLSKFLDEYKEKRIDLSLSFIIDRIISWKNSIEILSEEEYNRYLNEEIDRRRICGLHPLTEYSSWIRLSDGGIRAVAKEEIKADNFHQT